ncbi:hypothetical protein [Curtobacterium citreum]|uniref:hypothetical protein n=1 Tax=Curtobacterium citreum TaxID=2036 RepID=UPI000735FC6F|nr:hypothetical protein [Curtobacterium citreum]KTR07792.1 hypothetical protein NS330_14970 [Curtobacterium citreum]
MSNHEPRPEPGTAQPIPAPGAAQAMPKPGPARHGAEPGTAQEPGSAQGPGTAQQGVEPDDVAARTARAESLPLEERADAFAALHDELRTRLESGQQVPRA